ncbi:MAG: hypothetical protein AB1758_12930 [Candidatus Eremiobacterota bacterium]
MTCHEARRAWLENPDLPHLDRCPACQGWVEEVGRVRGMLRSALREPPPLRRPAARQRWWPAAAAVLAVGLWWGGLTYQPAQPASASVWDDGAHYAVERGLNRLERDLAEEF